MTSGPRTRPDHPWQRTSFQSKDAKARKAAIRPRLIHASRIRALRKAHQQMKEGKA